MVFLLLSLTLSGFDTPESMISDGEFIYVSCINGSPTKKDENGYIAKLKMDGTIVKKDFITGLDAPKGMWIVDSFLLVTDIDRVRIINLKKGDLIKTIDVDGAQFLNDITGGDGKIFVSDTKGNVVYQFDYTPPSGLKLETKIIVTGGPNGLYYRSPHLYIVTWNSGKVMFYCTRGKEFHPLTDGYKQLDGVWLEGNDIIFSSWDGNIYSLSGDKKTVLFKSLVSPADISLVNHVILIPEFMEDRIRIEKLE
ncbi:hypothetical protein DRQ17_05475 [bacterium]|nr:MAG: hypothetical protein DRQ17_05475 [bacterium]